MRDGMPRVVHAPARREAPQQQAGFLEGLADRGDEEARRVHRRQLLAQAFAQGRHLGGQQRAS